MLRHPSVRLCSVLALAEYLRYRSQVLNLDSVFDAPDPVAALHAFLRQPLFRVLSSRGARPHVPETYKHAYALHFCGSGVEQTANHLTHRLRHTFSERIKEVIEDPRKHLQLMGHSEGAHDKYRQASFGNKNMALLFGYPRGHITLLRNLVRPSCHPIYRPPMTASPG